MSKIISGLVNKKKGTVTLVTNEKKFENVYSTIMNEDGDILKHRFLGVRCTGNKAIVTKLHEEDTFDMYIGLAICVATFNVGSKTKLRQITNDAELSLETSSKLIVSKLAGSYEAFKKEMNSLIESKFIKIIE